MRNLNFVRPTWVKVIFPLQLLALYIIEVATDGIKRADDALILVPPAVVYYLLGCLVVEFVQEGKVIRKLTTVLAAAAALAFLDQAVKALIIRTISPESYLPVIRGVLHISHTQNHYGPWVFHKTGLPAPSNEFLIGVVLVYLLVIVAVYRYYVFSVRRSLYADLALLFMTGALVSTFFDLAVRGFTLDYLALPGIVVADLKDILIWFGLCCLVAELLTGPLYYRKMTVAEFVHAFGRMVRFQFRRN